MEILEQVTDSVYVHTEGKTIGNVGVIAGDEGNYIIDTSMYPIIARQIRNEIATIKSGNVLGAILTHYHFDHSGGNQIFHPHIHAHKHVLDNMKLNYDNDQMRDNLNKREDSDKFEGLELTMPNFTFETNPYRPDDSDHIEMYQVGGHTNGSSLIFYDTENTVFAGDNLFAGFFPWGGDPTASPYDWLQSCQMIIDKRPKIIVPGHGDVQHNLKEVELLKTYLETAISEGEKLIKDGVSSDDGVNQLLQIDSNPARSDDMKERTLQHWYKVMMENSR